MRDSVFSPARGHVMQLMEPSCAQNDECCTLVPLVLNMELEVNLSIVSSLKASARARKKARASHALNLGSATEEVSPQVCHLRLACCFCGFQSFRLVSPGDTDQIIVYVHEWLKHTTAWLLHFVSLDFGKENPLRHRLHDLSQRRQ